ncbi:TolC family protein [Sphingomonas montanisoli]|uniref:TolC family protein n=1 Tax=Sphingomonas montanisoli TaxID=2606412 RepID=A0A5D9BXU7_9SPHN|nr:TolC family protein [Sphingomonas montanisoli]TZG24408.1 TolC family protein [Sphingomonas montanisoli]
MHRIFAALLAVSGCASIAQAQSTDLALAGPSFTLDQALELAGASSPSLEVASAGIRSADAARTVAGLRPNPSIVTQTENVAGSGQYRDVRSAETTAGLELPIELGGKRSARIAVADARGQRAAIAAAVTLADLRLAVIQAYVEAVAAERRLATAREQSGLAAEGLRAARVRVRAGRASPIEEQRADVVRINAEAAVERAIRTLEVARGNLARRIGQPIGGMLDVAWFDRVAGYGPTQGIDPGGTLAMAAAQADVATADAQVRLARSQRVPDITLSASARRLAATNDTAAVFGVSIPFPVFNNGSAAVAQARAERDQSDAQGRVIALETAQAIAAAEAEVANAATTARTASGPALVAAQESARIARIGYREGKFGQLDLLDAERTLSETRAAAIDALAAYHDAQARRDRLTTAAPDLTKD